MPTQIQIRRGTTAQNDAFTGAVGEVTADTQVHTLRIHDGSQAGGYELALANLSNVTFGAGVATFLATPSSANLAAAVTNETGSGALVFATSPTLVTPALGTPASGVMTNVTGTASGLTAGNVTTNANLTGGVTSVGNAATVVTNANLTGGVTSVGNAATVVTNANLTGHVTSVGNAAVLGTFSSAQLSAALSDETGTGVAVFDTAPSFTTSIDGGETFAAFATPTTLTVGAAATTGTIGYNSTAASTTNISTGAVASATTKTINIGTGGASGSTSNVNLGSSNGGTVTINGNLTVSGTTTTVNSTTLDVSDKNITVAKGNTTDAGADGSGITVDATTTKTFQYDNTNTAFTSNQNINAASGKTYKINGTDVLSSTTLGSGVTGSSLTSVGTLASGAVPASLVTTGTFGAGAYTFPGALAITGALTGVTTLAASSNATIGGTLGVTGAVAANGGFLTKGLYSGNNLAILGDGTASQYNDILINGAATANFGFNIVFQSNGSSIGQLSRAGRVDGGASDAIYFRTTTAAALNLGANSTTVIGLLAGAATVTGTLGVTGAATLSSTLAASGLVTASGFGSNLFSAAGTGYNKLTVRNTTAGAGNGAQLSVGMDNDPDNFFIQAFSSTFTPSGFIRAAGAVVQGEGPGGLTVVSSQADFEIWTSPNGSSVTKRLTITGAGAATFSGTLGVTGAVTLSSTLTFPATAQIIGGSSNGLVIRNSANTADNFAVTDAGAATVRTTLGVTGATTLSSTLGVTGAATFSSTVQTTGLGVGTAPSATAGEIRATNNVTAYYSSDSRLKENVLPIPDALHKIKQLQGVEFDWTQEYITAHGGEDDLFMRRHDVGVIAQDVEKVLPEVVATRPDGYLAVRYEKLVPLLLQAIKELSAQVDELTKDK